MGNKVLRLFRDTISRAKFFHFGLVSGYKFTVGRNECHGFDFLKSRCTLLYSPTGLDKTN